MKGWSGSVREWCFELLCSTRVEVCRHSRCSRQSASSKCLFSDPRYSYWRARDGARKGFPPSTKICGSRPESQLLLRRPLTGASASQSVGAEAKLSRGAGAAQESHFREGASAHSSPCHPIGFMLPVLAMTGEAHVSVCAALRAGLARTKVGMAATRTAYPLGAQQSYGPRRPLASRTRARLPGGTMENSRESGSFRASS